MVQNYNFSLIQPSKNQPFLTFFLKTADFYISFDIIYHIIIMWKVLPMTMDDKKTKMVVSLNKESTTEFGFWPSQALFLIIEHIIYDLPVGFINFVLVEVHVYKSDTTCGVHMSQHTCNGVQGRRTRIFPWLTSTDHA